MSGLCFDSKASKEVSWLFQLAIVRDSDLNFIVGEEVENKDSDEGTKNILLLFLLNRKKIKTYLELPILN